jgi:hypothetical protein
VSHSLYGASYATHIKILALAAICSSLVVLALIGARPDAEVSVAAPRMIKATTMIVVTESSVSSIR